MMKRMLGRGVDVGACAAAVSAEVAVRRLLLVMDKEEPILSERGPGSGGVWWVGRGIRRVAGGMAWEVRRVTKTAKVQ